MAKKNKQAQGMKKQQPEKEQAIVKPRPEPEVEVRPEAPVSGIPDIECRLPEKDGFTVPETAIYLDVSERSVWRYIQHGRLEQVERRGQTFVPRMSIIKYRLWSRSVNKNNPNR